MAYPSHFHRLVLGGTLYTEKWNTSLNIAGDLPAVSDTMLAAMASAIGTWFVGPATGSGIGFATPVRLVDVKLNRIDPTGHYEDDVSRTHTYPSSLAGGGAGSPPVPQAACVATLKTAVERGRANKGRMFLPPVAGFINPAADGRATAADALRVANAVATLINTIRATYIAQYGPGSNTGGVAVLSNIGTGAMHYVTKVEVGRVIDTMRSRRASLVEDRQIATNPIVLPVLVP